MPTINDPLFARQWHFALMGDIRTIWNEYSGAGVTVGVYDDGLQYLHPDLDGNYDGSLHFVYNGETYDPDPILEIPGIDADGHGTSVAGLIAAEAGNGIGGVGVAWGASLTGVNLLSDDRLSSGTDAAYASYRHAASFDIMSNSWGYDPYFYDFLNRSDPTSVGAATEAAFGYATANGRDGLGTVIVKAAGNEAANANGEGINGSRFVVSVAALTSTGAVTSYSNYGTNILVSAGAASVTTDLLGGNGYNTTNSTAGNYASDFGGTSAATPLVSGVVALMMEANETLGWRDVREILATSAALTGSGRGGAAGFEVEGFTSQRGATLGSGDTWNGGGHAISRDYGFGRVDAFAAVRMAEVWSLWHAAPKTSANEATISYSTPGDFNVSAVNGTNKPSLAVTEQMWIDHIDVTVTFAFAPFDPQSGVGVDFTLVAPDGTRFLFGSASDAVVGQNDVLDTSGGFTWTFGVALALGMDTRGTWTLDVEGRGLGGNHGNITDFTLDFYGALPESGGNNVHHITKDFLTITGAGAANWNAGRDRVLTDDNGGTDWINLASIAGAVSLTLGSLGKLLVGGQLWATLTDGAQFENVVTGDGADRVTGSILANEIRGMRGNDVVEGMAGNDTLYGGTGDDRLSGGDDADMLYGDTGNDTLDGGAGNDVIRAGTGRDTVLLGEGNDTYYDDTTSGDDAGDTVLGGEGGDNLIGGVGADSLSGEAGNDNITGGTGQETLSGGAGADYVDGGAGNDSILGGDDGDFLTGGADRDRVFGDAGDDTVSGGSGNDTLNGGSGADIIVGQAGSDLLTGGAGADVFVFAAGFGADVIRDFQDNLDTLRFAPALKGAISTVEDFVAEFATASRGSVIFDFGDGNRLTVMGHITLAALYDDIVFA